MAKHFWLRLDNAAKIYPAARRARWSNVYRLSVTLTEEINCVTLQKALAQTLPRFPSMAVRLRKGVFWYYLEGLRGDIPLSEEASCPLTPMSKAETRRCGLRVIVYKNRIAIELFHSLTDGTGAMIFFKTLIARYISLRYNVEIPSGDGILDWQQAPKKEELEDSFLKNAAPIAASRAERTAWHIKGTDTKGAFLHLTTFTLSVDEILDKAHKKGVTVTAYLAAVMLDALQDLQAESVADISRRKPLKVLLPVNLRPLFESDSLRNFALYITPELLPRLGKYSFDEILRLVSAQLKLENTKKNMAMRIATNVESERLRIVRIMPLFVKNFVMKMVFNAVGERKSCLSLSNLGAVRLPREMRSYISHFDFILGPQASAPYNCGVVSFGDSLRVSFTRNIVESRLEYHFFKVLQREGVFVCVESNGKGE